MGAGGNHLVIAQGERGSIRPIAGPAIGIGCDQHRAAKASPQLGAKNCEQFDRRRHQQRRTESPCHQIDLGPTELEPALDRPHGDVADVGAPTFGQEAGCAGDAPRDRLHALMLLLGGDPGMGVAARTKGERRLRTGQPGTQQLAHPARPVGTDHPAGLAQADRVRAIGHQRPTPPSTALAQVDQAQHRITASWRAQLRLLLRIPAQPDTLAVWHPSAVGGAKGHFAILEFCWHGQPSRTLRRFANQTRQTVGVPPPRRVNAGSTSMGQDLAQLRRQLWFLQPGPGVGVGAGHDDLLLLAAQIGRHQCPQLPGKRHRDDAQVQIQPDQALCAVLDHQGVCIQRIGHSGVTGRQTSLTEIVTEQVDVGSGRDGNAGGTGTQHGGEGGVASGPTSPGRDVGSAISASLGRTMLLLGAAWICWQMAYPETMKGRRMRGGALGLVLLGLAVPALAAATGDVCDLATLCHRAEAIVLISDESGEPDLAEGAVLVSHKGGLAVGETCRAALGARARLLDNDVEPARHQAWLFLERTGKTWRTLRSGLRLITPEGAVFTSGPGLKAGSGNQLIPATPAYAPHSVGPYDAEACDRDIAAALSWLEQARCALRGSEPAPLLDLLVEPAWYPGPREAWDEIGQDLIRRYAELTTPTQLIQTWLDATTRRLRLRYWAMEQLPGHFSTIPHVQAAIAAYVTARERESELLLGLLGRCRLARPVETAVQEETRELLLGLGALELLVPASDHRREAALALVMQQAPRWWATPGGTPALSRAHPALVALTLCYQTEGDPDRRYALAAAGMKVGGGPGYLGMTGDALGLLAAAPVVHEVLTDPDGTCRAVLAPFTCCALGPRTLGRLLMPPVLELVSLKDGTTYRASSDRNQDADWCVVSRRSAESLGSEHIGCGFAAPIPVGSYRASLVGTWQDDGRQHREWRSLQRTIDLVAGTAWAR